MTIRICDLYTIADWNFCTSIFVYDRDGELVFNGSYQDMPDNTKEMEVLSFSGDRFTVRITAD